MCGFSVYTGKVANELLAENTVSTDECTTTTKTVMGPFAKNTAFRQLQVCVL